jgi:hypothetical protein
MENLIATECVLTDQNNISEPWDTLRAAVLAIRASRKSKTQNDNAYYNAQPQMFGELELSMLRGI